MSACAKFEWCDGDAECAKGDHRGYLVKQEVVDGNVNPVFGALGSVDQRDSLNDGERRDAPEVYFEFPEEWWARSPEELDAEIDGAIACLELIRERGHRMFLEAAK